MNKIIYFQLFFTLVAVVTFVLPAIIIASCYIAIILVIWTKGHNSRDSSLEQAALNGRQSRKNSSVNFLLSIFIKEPT